jgi:hypothetical protein
MVKTFRKNVWFISAYIGPHNRKECSFVLLPSAVDEEYSANLGIRRHAFLQRKNYFSLRIGRSFVLRNTYYTKMQIDKNHEQRNKALTIVLAPTLLGRP